MGKLLNVIIKSMNLLDTRTKKKMIAVGLLSLFTSFIDLLAVGIVGAVVALGVQSFSGASVGDRVSQLLAYFNLEDLQLTFQVAILSLVALGFLITRSIFALIITKRTYIFLNQRAVFLTESLLNRLFQAPSQEVIRARGSQKTLFSLSAGVGHITSGILGSFTLMVTDIILFASLFLGILFADVITATTALVIYIFIALTLYVRVNKSNQEIAASLTNLTVNNNTRILELLGVYRELFLRESWHTFVEKIIQDRNSYVVKQAQQKMIPIFNKYILEIVSVVMFALVCTIQFTQNESARAAGNLALFAVASSRIIPSLLRIQQNFITISSSSVAATDTFRLIEELNEQLKEVSPNQQTKKLEFANTPPLISLNNVSYHFNSESGVGIQNVSLILEPGQFLALVGKSGAGKSTILDLILGLKEPSSGEVLYDHVPLNKYKSKKKLTIGFVPQSTVLINASIRENILLGVSNEVPDSEWYRRVLDITGVSDLLKRRSISDLEIVGENGSNLSGGEKQKIGLARAIINKPVLLILDEATSSLDEKADRDFGNLLYDVHKESNLTIVMVAHRSSTVSRAKEIAVIRDGTIEAKGSIQHLLSTSSVFQEIYNNSLET